MRDDADSDESENEADIEVEDKIKADNKAGITMDVAHVNNVSQILEYAKKEMETVYKTCIIERFTQRMRSCIRWEIFDCMKNDKLFRGMKKGRNAKLPSLWISA